MHAESIERLLWSNNIFSTLFALSTHQVTRCLAIQLFLLARKGQKLHCSFFAFFSLICFRSSFNLSQCLMTACVQLRFLTRSTYLTNEVFRHGSQYNVPLQMYMHGIALLNDVVCFTLSSAHAIHFLVEGPAHP